MSLGLKLEKRMYPSFVLRVLTPILVLLLVFLIIVGIMMTAGIGPVNSISIFLRVFTNSGNIIEVFVRFGPLLLVSLGLSVAFRASFWNIGGEGQIIVGAAIATWLALNLSGVTPLLGLPLIFVASFLFAGGWAWIPAALKTRVGINEVVVTIMMNYIAIYLLEYLLLGPLGTGKGFPESPIISAPYTLPILLTGTRLHLGILISVAFIAVYWALFRSTLGYNIRAVGCQPRAARAAGVNLAKTIEMSAIISGGFAGIAGMMEVTGLHHQLLTGITSGYGFSAIIVAWLGDMDYRAVPLVALLFSFFTVGAEQMLLQSHLPSILIDALQGLILILMLVFSLFAYYRVGRK